MCLPCGPVNINKKTKFDLFYGNLHSYKLHGEGRFVQYLCTANRRPLIWLSFIQTEDLSKSEDVKEPEEKTEGEGEKETKRFRQEDEVLVIYSLTFSLHLPVSILCIFKHFPFVNTCLSHFVFLHVSNCHSDVPSFFCRLLRFLMKVRNPPVQQRKRRERPPHHQQKRM